MPDTAARGSRPTSDFKARIRSKGRGTSIRQLFSQAGDVIRQMTVFFWMSPLSVAQYIDPSMPRFDLAFLTKHPKFVQVSRWAQCPSRKLYYSG